MKNIITIIFILVAYSAFSQSHQPCNSSNQAKEGTYLVRLIEGTYESLDAKPRFISDDEKCLIELERNIYQETVLKLDDFTEVLIYPTTKITKLNNSNK
jgi:hypothetical protein